MRSTLAPRRRTRSSCPRYPLIAIIVISSLALANLLAHRAFAPPAIGSHPPNSSSSSPSRRPHVLSAKALPSILHLNKHLHTPSFQRPQYSHSESKLDTSTWTQSSSSQRAQSTTGSTSHHITGEHSASTSSSSSDSHPDREESTASSIEHYQRSVYSSNATSQQYSSTTNTSGLTSSGTRNSASASSSSSYLSPHDSSGELPESLKNARQEQEVFVTFATSSVKDFVYNWLQHTRDLQLEPRIVGSMDDTMLIQCRQWDAPSLLLQGHSILDNRKVNFLRTSDKDFRKMGTVKTRFIKDLLDLNLRPIVSDADVVWLRDPRPYLNAGSYGTADALVSNDCIDVPGDAKDRSQCAHVQVNTGILHFRPTNASKAFVQEWHERVLHATEAWMRDQPTLNILIKEGISGRIPVATNVDENNDRRVYSAWYNRLRLGILPNWLFANGHVYFVQQLHKHYSRPQDEPYSVHMTYQYGDDPHYGFGKRQRLRESHLWRLDNINERLNSKFLVLSERGARVQFEGSERVGNDKDAWYTAISRHFAEDWHRRNSIANALALARKLGRSLVLPRARCFCDKIWNSLNACRAPGAETFHLPFECPMDHIFAVSEWHHSDVDFREAGFLEHPDIPTDFLHSWARVNVQPMSGFPAYDSFASAHNVSIPGGMTVDSIAEELSAVNHANVLEIDNFGEGTLCGYKDEKANRDFDALVKPLMRHIMWYCFTEVWRDKQGRPNTNPYEHRVVERHCSISEAQAQTKGYMQLGIVHNSVQPNTTCSCEWGFAFPEALSSPARLRQCRAVK